MLYKTVAQTSYKSGLREMELYLVATDDEDQAERLTRAQLKSNPFVYSYKLRSLGERMFHIASIPDSVQVNRVFSPFPGSKIWVGVHYYRLTSGLMQDVVLLLGHSTNESALRALGTLKFGSECSYTVFPIKLAQVTPLYYVYQYPR